MGSARSLDDQVRAILTGTAQPMPRPIPATWIPPATSPTAPPIAVPPSSPEAAFKELTDLLATVASQSATKREVAALETRLIEIRSRLVTQLSREQIEALVAKGVAATPPKTLHLEFGDGRPAFTVDGVRHEAMEDVLLLASRRRPVLMIGPAGCGKTWIAAQCAKAMGLSFGSVSVTAGMSEGVLTGRLLPIGDGGKFVYVESEFVHAYENGGAFLLDELDAGDANTLLVINQAVAGDRLPLPNRIGSPYAVRHKDFTLFAAANTFGTGANRLYVGRNQLDEATLDRFRMGQIEMDYDARLEDGIVADAGVVKRFRDIRNNVNRVGLRRVVSTRAMVDADIMRRAGWSLDRCTEQLTRGWTRDEMQKSGVAQMLAA